MPRPKIKQKLKNGRKSISLPIEYIKWMEKRPQFKLSKFVCVALGEYINKMESS